MLCQSEPIKGVTTILHSVHLFILYSLHTMYGLQLHILPVFKLFCDNIE